MDMEIASVSVVSNQAEVILWLASTSIGQIGKSESTNRSATKREIGEKPTLDFGSPTTVLQSHFRFRTLMGPHTVLPMYGAARNALLYNFKMGHYQAPRTPK